MTNTTRRTLRHKMRRHPTPCKQGKKKDGIVKSVPKRRHKGHVLQNRRKSACDMRTGQAEIYAHEFKSLRVRDRGYYKHFVEDDDGLEHFTAYCGDTISHGNKYNNDDGDVEDDDDDDDDDDNDENDDDDDDDDDDAATWKYTTADHDGDWMPKSHEKSWVRDYNDNVISHKHAHGANNGGNHHLRYDDDNDDSDHDNAISSKHSCDEDHTPNEFIDDRHHHNDDDNNREVTRTCSYHNSADESSMIHIDEDGPETDRVGYVRRKRRSMDSLLKGCNKRSLPRGESKCSMTSSRLGKLTVFPSWKTKKPRVVCKKQDKADEGLTNAATANQLENGRGDVHCELNTAVQHMQQHTQWNNACTSQTWQRSRSVRPNVTAMSQMQGEPPLSTRPNSPAVSLPAVSLSSVLEGLPKDFAESELTTSLHGDDASNNQPSNTNTTNGIKKPSAQQTQEETAEDITEKEKSQAPMGKPKRKKHRPKVQRDLSQKAKRTPKNIQKKAPPQEGDGLQTEKQKKVRKKRQSKKGQDMCDSTMESSTMLKKKRGRKQGRASPADASNRLKENLGTECLYSFNGENSIIPFQSPVSVGAHDQYSQKSTLQNLMVREIACMHDLLATKDELSMYMHMAEGHISLTPELINCTQGNKLALYSQFLGQHIPRFIHESRLPPSNSMEELAIVYNKLSLVHSKPDSSTQLLLAQEPHNQLEMVVYNQKREMVVSKPTKSRVKIRAKVQLDAENERMWPLLVLGGIPTDFEDVLYWERERAIMKRHVTFFIHNMQSVQGDRHFSPWKGSILDSVVGAFLTQNVSDHLSSSAFMSVASRYPSIQRNDTENAHMSDETPNKENERALEMSKMSDETQDMYKTCSGSIDEGSSKQLHGPGTMTSSCGITIECTENIKPCSSLRAVKSTLRNNGSSHPIETRAIENNSDSVTPVGTPIRALTDKDSGKQSGTPPLDSNFKDSIQMEQSDRCVYGLNHTSSRSVDYTREMRMLYLDKASPHLMEVNVSMEPSDTISSLDHNNDITVDYIGQSSSQNASFSFLTENEDTTKKSILNHNGIPADYIGQSGMQNLEKASSQLDTSTKSCSNSSSVLGHHNGTSANHKGQSGMQQGPMEQGITKEPSDISTSSLSAYTYTMEVDLQHLNKALPCSMQEDISMKRNDLHDKSIIVKPDVCNSDDRRQELLNLCSSISTEVSCNHESMSSASNTRVLVDGSNTNTFLQEAGLSIVKSPTFELCTTDGSWPSPGPRTEVYYKSTVCRSLFKNHVSVQRNSDTTTVLNANNNEQDLKSFNTSSTENHLAVIQESKQMACGSDIVHDMVAQPPISTIVGNKRRHSLSGIERAHLEENQHGRKKNYIQDWESMRRRTLESCSSNENSCEENLRRDAHQDSVDWDVVRRASVEELAETIKERGMHHVLSGRIKAFLKTLHEEQGSLDLEWLRKVSPENAKAYLMGIRGLGVKSVECIRLLTLHHVAFPVDVNVGRICVRLGWVPIEPLPEQLQLHLLELYPVQETIQKFLWPRLCMLDQKTLYELHYQLITFGKVFCTKSKPNCNACPMRSDCKHFASAYASAKLLLTGSNDEPSKRLCSGTPIPALTNSPMSLEGKTMVENVESNFAPKVLEKDNIMTNSLSKCQPYFVEEPASPEDTREPETEQEIADIEDFPYIYGSLNDFTEELLKVSELSYESISGHSGYTLQEISKKWEKDTNSVDAGIEASCITTGGSCSNTTEDQFSAYCTITATRSAFASCASYESGNPSHETFSSYESVVEEAASDVSAEVCEEATNALVSLPEGAYIPAPKLKNIDRLRTIHYVYELPDNHPLLEHAEIREKDDPSFYLLAIWSPGEAPDSLSGIDEDCQEDLCRFSNANADETVSGTLLIPCRTAMRGRFPLNGTYFQVNEVFADHASSLRPFQVPRSTIWRLKRRFVYFGTSVSNIFRGLTSEEIKSCFLRGHVCVRGFDRKYRTPKPLVCRLHFPISKQIQRHKKDETEASYKN